MAIGKTRFAIVIYKIAVLRRLIMIVILGGGQIELVVGQIIQRG